MQILNNNPLDLAGEQGEVITVEVTETAGNPLLVSYALNGKKGSLPTGNQTERMRPFTLDKAKRDPTLLTLLFTFTNSNTGNYDITISGDKGGQVSHYSVTQRFFIPGNSVTYTFDIV